MFDPRRLFRAGSSTPQPTADLARDPALRAALTALARGDASTALRGFDHALAQQRLAPALEAQAQSKRGVALIALDRRAEALEAFARAIAIDEGCVAALVNVGNLLVEDDAALDALDFYTAAIAVDATYAPAYRGLGIANRRLGRREAAVRAFKAESKHSARRV